MLCNLALRKQALHQLASLAFRHAEPMTSPPSCYMVERLLFLMPLYNIRGDAFIETPLLCIVMRRHLSKKSFSQRVSLSSRENAQTTARKKAPRACTLSSRILPKCTLPL